MHPTRLDFKSWGARDTASSGPSHVLRTRKEYASTKEFFISLLSNQMSRGLPDLAWGLLL